MIFFEKKVSRNGKNKNKKNKGASLNNRLAPCLIISMNSKFMYRNFNVVVGSGDPGPVSSILRNKVASEDKPRPATIFGYRRSGSWISFKNSRAGPGIPRFIKANPSRSVAPGGRSFRAISRSQHAR